MNFTRRNLPNRQQPHLLELGRRPKHWMNRIAGRGCGAARVCEKSWTTQKGETGLMRRMIFFFTSTNQRQYTRNANGRNNRKQQKRRTQHNSNTHLSSDTTTRRAVHPQHLRAGPRRPCHRQPRAVGGQGVNDCDIDERGRIVLDVDVAGASLAVAITYLEGDRETGG